MLLAEALQERADNAKRIEQLKHRINTNAVMQENVAPAEEPKELLKELDGLIERQTYLIAAINLTNSAAVSEGVTLTELIAKRDMLTVKISAYRGAADSASYLCQKHLRTEIAQVSALNVKELREKTDKLSAELRKTDNRIQKLNWSTELKEL